MNSNSSVKCAWKKTASVGVVVGCGAVALMLQQEPGLDPDQVVEQGRRLLRPGTVVTAGRGIERRSQACGIPHVAG
jgi:hypothetical protein